jgi:hypothetical protein
MNKDDMQTLVALGEALNAGIVFATRGEDGQTRYDLTPLGLAFLDAMAAGRTTFEFEGRINNIGG